MIRYALSCADGHDFESWFQSSAAFERLQAAGMISCAVCGSGEVEKRLMSPSLPRSEPAGEEAPPGPLSAPPTPAEQALQALRCRIRDRGESVGRRFPAEARAIAAGEAPERPIYGQATPAEARTLLEDGLPVMPLPFDPDAEAN